MLWRIITAAIVLFWAVMTGLLLRDTYFPERARFAEVPPRFVFELFLNQSGALNNNLHLYHEGKKIGHASFQIRRVAHKENTAVTAYDMLFTGLIRQAEAPPNARETSWRFGGELVDGEQWRRIEFQGQNPTEETQATFSWKAGDAAPSMEIYRGGKLVMDAGMAKAMMALQGMSAGNGSSTTSPAAALFGMSPATIKLVARESFMELAGKRRKCYVVSLPVMASYELRLLFTEIGELARMDLPGGYSLLEPTMHGLEKGIHNSPP